jgi:hypothetical protein
MKNPTLLPPPHKPSKKTKQFQMTRLKFILALIGACTCTALVTITMTHYLTEAQIYYNLSIGTVGVVCQK